MSGYYLSGPFSPVVKSMCVMKRCKLTAVIHAAFWRVRLWADYSLLPHTTTLYVFDDVVVGKKRKVTTPRKAAKCIRRCVGV
jgi:hypothetical protein